MPVVRSNWKKMIFEVKQNPRINLIYILNAHILATKNKEPFFFLYTLICFIWTLKLLKPALYISIDLHMNYEQRRQWRGMGSPKRPKKTDCIIHCTNSSDALIQPNSLEFWKLLVAAANFQQHTAILEVFSSTMQYQHPYVHLLFSFLLIFTKESFYKITYIHYSKLSVKFIHLGFKYRIRMWRWRKTFGSCFHIWYYKPEKNYTMHGWTVSSSKIYLF